jgi:hypothetical protein
MTQEAPTWEDTLPHFSTCERGGRITAPPLNAPDMLGLIAAVSFVLWIPVTLVAAIYVDGIDHSDTPWWQLALGVLYAMCPLALTRLTADQARDRFGQHSTAYRVAVVPVFAGAAAGLLIAALWIGGYAGRLTALASAACWMIAALVTLAACWGIRRTRKRQAWITAMRHYGRRSPGVLRETTFLEKWRSGEPQFTVKVECANNYEWQWIAANMTTSAFRVPLPGTPVIVFSAQHDTDVHIELDHTGPVEFDTDCGRYVEPSGS